MPELPEVETVRRNLETAILGRTFGAIRLSGLDLREPMPVTLPRRLRGLTVAALRRHGKYLLADLDRGLTLISHLGMSGRWLFFVEPPTEALPHVHFQARFRDGTQLWFQDSRRFGLLRVARTSRLAQDPALAALGPDPIASKPLNAEALQRIAQDARTPVKSFLLDQRRIAGIGNIYASEILFRARVDPRRAAGGLDRREWGSVARATDRVLRSAIERMGTTFSMYRTLWNEPGTYADRLMVYDRAEQPCRTCRRPIRRIVQAQRSTYFCPGCQPRRRPREARSDRARRGSGR